VHIFYIKVCEFNTIRNESIFSLANTRYLKKSKASYDVRKLKMQKSSALMHQFTQLAQLALKKSKKHKKK